MMGGIEIISKKALTLVMSELFISTKADRTPDDINWMSNWKGHFLSMCHFHLVTLMDQVRL